VAGLTVDDVVRQVDAWAGAASLRVVPLAGGLTNENYRVDVDGRSFVVRLGGRDTELLGIDRARECAAAAVAAGLGIGPEVVWARPEDAVLVTRFVAGRVLDPEDVRDPGMLGRIAGTLKRLHGGPAIPGTFSVFRTIEAYRETADRYRVALPPELDRWLALAGRIEAVSPRIGAVPCHNDLLAANFVDEGGQLRLLDWEYAGMGDPYFDLGNLAANAELGPGEERRLLKAYGDDASEAAQARLGLMRLVSDLREALWGLVQAGVSRLAFDYPGYAARHFARVAERAGTPTVDAWLAIHAGGAKGLTGRPRGV
jgi:thiamine kinase-like enzyme